MTKTKAVDARWFKDRLADKQISQRQFAKMLGLDPSAITRFLDGDRNLSMDEAVAFATICGVTLDDVMRRTGVKLPSANGKGAAPVVGWVDDRGIIHQDGADAAHRTVPLPPECPADSVAVRYKAPESASSVMDGWLYYYTRTERVPPEAIGKICVVQVKAGPAMLVHLRKGYTSGTYSIRPLAIGAEMAENVVVERAAPILWIRTS
ncbi:MAG: helix-turn-helix transcriptional regulator [Pseudomonadota bacterium]